MIFHNFFILYRLFQAVIYNHDNLDLIVILFQGEQWLNSNYEISIRDFPA